MTPNSMILVVGAILLLAVGLKAQNRPCDSLNSTNGEDVALFISVREVSSLDLAQAKSTGVGLANYRGRIQIYGILDQNITLQLQETPQNSNCLDKFEIVSDSSNQIYLQLKSGVDRDGATAATLDDFDRAYCQIQCDTAGRRTIFLPVTVTIIDVNDNAPRFLQAPYSRTVDELTPIGTTVFREISASDKDDERNKEVDFFLVPGDLSRGASKFSIDLPRQGFLTVNDTLDFETLYYTYNTNMYNLTILGQDTGTPSLSTSTSLVITVEDGDDLGPMFVYPGCVSINVLYPICIEPEFTANIVSRTLPASNVVQTFPVPPGTNNQPVTIRARDQDTLNAAIDFSLETTDYSSNFRLSTPTKISENGVDFYEVQLLQQQTIDRAVSQKLFLIIRAQERTTNRRFATSRISVSVNPANQFAPVLSTNTIGFTGYVYENSQVGTMVTNQAGNQAFQLIVSDQDLIVGDTAGYNFTFIDSTPFSVTLEGFVAVASNVLDFETNSRYTPAVVVTEMDTAERRSSTTTLTINVLDVNDFAPAFPQGGYSREIPARDYTTSWSLITQVQASDSDSGVNGQVTYSIVSATNNGIGKFSISDINNAANVFVAGSVTRGDQYILTIRATDRADFGQLSGETVLIVTVVADGNTIPRMSTSQYIATYALAVSVRPPPISNY